MPASSPAAFCSLLLPILRETFALAGALGAGVGGIVPGTDPAADADGHDVDELAGAAAAEPATPAPVPAPVASSSCVPLVTSGCSGTDAGAS